MVRIEVRYESDLHCVAVHAPSAAELATDAPVDNQGRGESYSPTDLVATGLGTCMLTLLAITARRLGRDVPGATVSVEKGMVADPRRRIGRLTVELRVPGEWSDEERATLEQAARTCPVAESIHPDIETEASFVWDAR